MALRDSRRIQGPEKTTPYCIYQNDIENRMDFPRLDGRTPTDIQRMFISVDVVSQAKGSSFIEVGNTKVVCGVHGPREIQRGTDFKLIGQVSCEVKFAPFSSKVRKCSQPDRRQKEISGQLKEALETVVVLEKFPKAQIDVCITVIEDGGSLLSTCLTAAGLALCHASIDVYDLVIGVDLLWREGMALINPTLIEEENLAIQRLKGQDYNGSLTLGMMPKFAKGQIVLLAQEGELSCETTVEGIRIAMETCLLIYNLARQTLVNHVDTVLSSESPSLSAADQIS